MDHTNKSVFFQSIFLGTTGPLSHKKLFNDFLQKNNQIQNKTHEILKDYIPYSSMNNFTQNIVLCQHELLNKALSSLVINSTKELDFIALDNILKKHRFCWSVKQ